MAARAQIVDTHARWARAARITIQAPPDAVFGILTDPARHSDFDGSGTVTGNPTGDERLVLGSHFGMGMRIKLPYRTDNTVVEFEQDRLIAWCHFNRHRWRYELEPTGDGSTVVTETFDARTALFPPALLLMNAYANNEKAVARTLVRLKDLVEGSQPEA